jgi:hypothetical protein
METFSAGIVDNIKKSSYKILSDKIIVTLNKSAPLTDVACDKLEDLMQLVYGSVEVIFLGDPECLPYHKRIWQQVRQDVRDYVHDGVNIDKSWFSDDKVKISTNDGDVIVEGRNAFFRSFIKNNYEGYLERAFARYEFSLDRYEHNALRFIKDETNR